MNGISEHRERRVYSSSNHYGFIYQFVTDRIFYESRFAGRGDWVHFSDNFGQGFGGITDLEIGPDGQISIHSLNWAGENIQNCSFLTFTIE
jgi:hypothetical protein